ncbi:MAG: hypothetical protein ACR2GH_15785 [Pseudonocardia sp.]
MNRVGVEAGLQLSYDDSAVCHWLAGTLPRDRVRPVVCEVLSRRLGRPLTLASASLGAEQYEDAADTVTGLIDLGSADMDPSRRAALGAIGLYSSALVIPGWADVSGRFELLRTNPRVRIGYAEVDAVRSMTDHLSTLDDQFGGRAVRPMAAAFLVNTITPYLHAEATFDIRAQMLSAAADHCYLTGYMAMDERADGLAQHYYVKALELAGHANDHLTYCTTMRGMSVLAVDLRHTSDALRLADAASAAAPQAGPRMLAFLTGQQAHAAAQAGDRVQALAKLREAEAAMDRAESRAKAFGSYDPSSMNYHIAQVRYELGDRAESITAMEESDRLRYQVYRRGRVRHLGTLAERRLEIGRLEEACSAWGRMLDDYPAIQSGRCDDRFNTMMSTLRPYLRNRDAKELYARGRNLMLNRK